jgi:hypothetical protein
MLDGANTSALVLAQAAASFSRGEFANMAAALALQSLFSSFAAGRTT